MQNIRMEQDFMLVNLSRDHMGILKTFGTREIVADIKLLEGGNENDNTWLMDKVISLYKEYHAKVLEVSIDEV